jgi:hypothetical protein
MHRLSVVLIAALGVALAAGCCSIPGNTVPVVHDQVYPAAGLAEISIEHENGRVTVTGWDRQEIQVRVLNGRGVDRISVETAGDRMTVRTVSSTSAGLLGTGAEYEVSIPSTLERIGIETSNGQIQVVDCNGTVDAGTSNGAIRLTGTRTVERLSSSNGAIDAEIRALDADAQVTTSNGAIRLALAPAINATVEARTSNGQVTVSGLTLTASDSRPNELEGMLGAGGPRLVVETSNGAITLSAL